jgi:hypothetical protein
MIGSSKPKRDQQRGKHPGVANDSNDQGTLLVFGSSNQRETAASNRFFAEQQGGELDAKERQHYARPDHKHGLRTAKKQTDRQPRLHSNQRSDQREMKQFRNPIETEDWSERPGRQNLSNRGDRENYADDAR